MLAGETQQGGQYRERSRKRLGRVKAEPSLGRPAGAAVESMIVWRVSTNPEVEYGDS
jgi:hypothetical protein